MDARTLAYGGKRRGGCGGDDFLGMDTKEMRRGERIGASLSVLVPVVFSGFFLVAFFPQVWWIFTIYGWVVFPAFGLLMSGLAGVPAAAARSGGSLRVPGVSKERELLGALKDHGELSAITAASETSLTVEEAEKMLQELAGDGHLEVRVGGGGIFYALWKSETEAKEIESGRSG